MPSEIISALLAFALAILPLFFPEQPIERYIIYFLALALLYLLSVCIRLHLKNRELRKELDNIIEKHRTIATSFDAKRNLLRQYRAGFQSLEYMITSIMASSKQDRFSVFYEWFTDFKLKMKDNDQ